MLDVEVVKFKPKTRAASYFSREEFNRRLGSGFDPYKPCQTNPECRVIDMNMICSPQKTCACRPDMKWNSDTGECQGRYSIA